MAERRTEDSGTTSRGQEELTQRINKAYASSEPAQRDTAGEQAGTSRPGGRFAAALGRKDSSAPTAPQPATAGATATGTATSARPASKRVRKAHLRLTHIDPWSVMKTSFLFSIALGIVTVVAVGVVWAVLGAAGIWESIDSTVADVVGETGGDFRIEDYLGMSRVMGFTMIVAVVDVVLVTVIGTLGAFLYNLAAALLGGIEVVLAEEDR
jgi:Transmembrane domain of unknown function (DUF3566)